MTAKELVSKTDEEIMRFLIDHKDEYALGLKNAKVIVNALYKYQIFKVLKKVEIIIVDFGMGSSIKSYIIYFRNNDNTFTKIVVTYFFHDEAMVDICVCDLKTDAVVGSIKKIKCYGKRII